jgi:hypothetical protein
MLASDLPKFLIADDLDSDRVFVVHTQAPRFIAEVKEHDGKTVLDPEWDETPADFSDATVRELMQAASAFYRRTQRPGSDTRN